MAMTFAPPSLPFGEDEQGVIRVKGSRVPIDFLIYDYKAGATADVLARDYPSVKLADIHAVLSYYLLHQNQLDSYLARQEQRSEEKRHEVQGRSSHNDLAKTLRSRPR